MILALGIVPIVGIMNIANDPTIFAQTIGAALTQAGPKNSSLTGGVTGFSSAMVALGGFSWCFGYLGGTPQLTTRFMAIKDFKQARQARNIGIAWTLIAYVGALSLGWIGIAIWGPGTVADPETIFPAVMMRLFPPTLAAIFIVGAMAAMISTADSLLILAATEFSENIVKPHIFKGNVTPEKSLHVSRVLTALMAVIALGTAYILPSNLIYTITGYVWAGIGCPFSAIILLSLFWKKFNAKAALSTIVIGLAFTIFWITSGYDAQIMTSRVMSFFVALAVGVITSLVTASEEDKTPAAKARA
jgi:sodium/proline symporter